MSDKYLYRDIQTADRGRGYAALDLLANLAYVQAGGVFLWTVWTLGHAGIDMNAMVAGIFALLGLAVEVLAIYVLRLVLRSLLVMRDRAAHELIDQDSRYKTSSSST